MADATERKTWFMIARADSLDPDHSLKYRGAVVLYPSAELAESERVKLLPPERQDDYQVAPAKLLIGPENGWRVVPTELLSAMEKDWRKD